MKLLFFGKDGWPTEKETNTLLYACAAETCYLYEVKKGAAVPECACGEPAVRAVYQPNPNGGVNLIVPVQPMSALS